MLKLAMCIVLLDGWKEVIIFLTFSFPYVCVCLSCRCKQDTSLEFHCSSITIHTLFSFPSLPAPWKCSWDLSEWPPSSCKVSTADCFVSSTERWAAWHRARFLHSQSPSYLWPEDLTALTHCMWWGRLQGWDMNCVHLIAGWFPMIPITSWVQMCWQEVRCDGEVT